MKRKSQDQIQTLQPFACSVNSEEKITPNEETLSKEDLLSILKKLQNEMECSVCRKVLNPPLCLCENEHYICESCNKYPHSCGRCGSDRKFLKVNKTPKLVTNILDILPKKCKYSDDGCTYLSVSNVLKDHEMVCPFRNIRCVVCSTWSGKANQLTEHIKNGCTPFAVPYACQYISENQIKRGIIFPINFNKNETVVHTVEGQDCIYWMYCKVDKKKDKFLTFFVYIPTGKSCDGQLISELFFSKRNSIFKLTFTQTVFKEDCNIESIFSSENCVAISLSQLSHFMFDDSKLNIEFKIFVLDQPREIN